MRKGQIVCVLALLLSGCVSPVGTAAHGSSSAPTTPSTSSSTSNPSGSPSSASGVAANLTCRLPAISPAADNEPPGGWITFPGGQFVRDPASLAHRLQMHLPSYDRAIGAWVPVEPQYVAPDGASYVLHNESSLDNSGAFYLVDAKTGSRRLLLSQEGPTVSSYWTVVDYASEGIYLSAPAYGMTQPVPGLWLLDPQTGHVRLIEGGHYWLMVAGSTAWALDPPGPPANSSRVYRLDLHTGQVSAWYETKSDIKLLSPTPEGELLIDYGKIGSPRLALLAAPGLFVPIELPTPLPPIFNARLAAPGVWLSIYGEAWSGIALYLKGEGVTIMAQSPADPRPGYPFFYDAAGDCS